MLADLRAAKVPQVTLIFWVIKICATTLGETAGDAVSMSMGLGYLLGTALFAALFAMAVAMQIAAQRFKPVLYWATIIATTTVGTTLHPRRLRHAFTRHRLRRRLDLAARSANRLLELLVCAARHSVSRFGRNTAR